MTCYADLAADLLNESANFFVKVAQGRPDMMAQMEQNAETFRKMSVLLRDDPAGAMEHLSHGEMAARLLEDSAQFFLSIAETNEPIREQMEQNANVFREIAVQVRENPAEIVPESAADV